MIRLAILMFATVTVVPTGLTGRVDVRTAAGRAAAPAIVYAEPVVQAALPRPLKATLTQQDKSFVPAVIAVPVGSTIDFPNKDAIFHNVFSLSNPSPFDLGLYRSGASKSRTFTEAGVYRVFCNIHPQMTAVIAVVPTPYMTVAANDGQFQLDVPPGSYRVTALSERAAPVSVEVSVTPAAATVPPLTLDESQHVAAPHKNKFGQDYPATAYPKKSGG